MMTAALLNRAAWAGFGAGQRSARVRVLVLAALYAGTLLLLVQPPAHALTDPPAPVTGNATWFDALGQPYGGCGLPQTALDSQNFVALNVFNTPGDYNQYPRPIPASQASKIGMWNNGLNCGRWVQVAISDLCTGTNDGAPNQAFCRNGSFVADAYNGATLTMIVADSCGDSNAWCRDDPYHLDLAKASLNTFVKNGAPVGNMYPDHWNNRHVSWQFVPAPNYSGDINIGFLQSAQVWWPAISVSHLANGIHGVEYFANGGWQSAPMNGDMGESYIIGGTTAGANEFQIRVRDASDNLINGGRVYNFTLPGSCGSSCPVPYTPVTYTATAGSPGPTATATATATPTATQTTSPTASPTRSAAPGTCAAAFRTVTSWQGGFQGEVAVTNTGTLATTAWTVTMTMPTGESIVQLWNGALTPNGNVATVKNLGYNGNLAPNASTNFGFTANSSGPVTAPAVTCTPS